MPSADDSVIISIKWKDKGTGQGHCMNHLGAS